MNETQDPPSGEDRRMQYGILSGSEGTGVRKLKEFGGSVTLHGRSLVFCPTLSSVP